LSLYFALTNQRKRMPDFSNRLLVQSEAAIWQGLLEEKGAAIEYVWRKTDSTTRHIGRVKGLADEEFLETRTDTMMLLIRKIQAGEFVPDTAKVTTYYVEIFRRVVQNAVRKAGRQKNFDVLDETHLLFADETTYITDSAHIDLLMACLGKLGDTCQKLIRLRYFDELTDEEVLKKKLTEYTTSDSLRNRRSQCLKKLRALCSNSTTYTE